MDMIKYGIGFSYLPDWGVQEALREIYQNFTDYGEFNEEVYDVTELEGVDKEADDVIKITLENDFIPENFEFLQIGKSGKRGNKSKVGEHGEGLKMGMMVLFRRGHAVKISTTSHLLQASDYDDEFLGNCFGIEISPLTLTKGSKKFKLQYSCRRHEYETFKDTGIAQEDIIFKDSFHGSIINKNKGDIYVGGTFVCNLPGFTHAYDFPPERITLDRDRKIPSGWDVKYHSSKIVEAQGVINKVADLNNEDHSMIDRVPEKTAKKFKATIIDGEVGLIAGKVVATRELSAVLLKHPIVSSRVAKLKAKLIRKSNPYSILRGYADTHGHTMNVNAKTDLKTILIQAKTWK